MTKDSTHPGGFVPTALAKEMAVCSLTSDRATAAMKQGTNMDSGEWAGLWGKLTAARPRLPGSLAPSAQPCQASFLRGSSPKACLSHHFPPSQPVTVEPAQELCPLRQP